MCSTARSPLPCRGLNTTRTTIATLVGVLCCAGVQAEDATQLEPIEVWATEVKASSVKIDNEALLTRQADHISDLLRTIPGVDVGGAHSLNQRITIRSMDDKDLQISIDGAKQNSYMFHHMGNLQIAADILESAEIEIGSNSVLDGGLGGSARFKTKSADSLLQEGEQFGGRVQATYGDNSGSNATFTTYGRLSNSVDFLAYVNGLKRDNYTVGGGKILDYSGEVIAGTDGDVRGLEGDLNNALFKLGWDINDGQRLEFSYEKYVDEGDYSQRPDMGLATDIAIADSLAIPLLWPTEFTRDTLRLNYTMELGESSFLDISAYSNVSDLWRDESGYAENAGFAAFAGQTQGEAKNTGLNLLGETELGNQLLTYGVELNTYDTDYTFTYNDPATPTDRGSEKSEELALYIQDEIEISSRFSLTPGLRYDQSKLDSTLVDDTFDSVTSALAARFDVNSKVQLRASTTQLYKAPEIGEVFVGAGSTDTPNPDIKAEEGLNAEVTLAFEDAIFGADRFAAGLTAFKTTVDNYIYDYAVVNDEYLKDNVGDMNIDGFEAYLAYDVGQLSTLLSFSKAESDLDAFSEHSDFEGARLDRTQGDTISLNIDYALSGKQVSLHWDTLYVDDVKAGTDLDGAGSDNAKDGYVVHNVSARWRPARVKGLTLTFGIDNLADEFYASQSSRTGLSTHPRFGELYLVDYEPGRNAKITASYEF